MILKEVSEFLAHPVRMFVGGQWIESGQMFEVKDPGKGQRLAVVCEGGEKEIDRAVEAAERAFQKTKWAALTMGQRAAYLRRLADAVEKHRMALAEIESLNVGKTLKFALGDVDVGAGALRFYADLADRVPVREKMDVAGFKAYTMRQPYGVCGFIFPWNFPFLLAIWGIAPALLAGNTVVVKPAEDTPLSTLYLCKLIEEADFPAGVVNVVAGFGSVAGAALASHPKIKRISFTGSPEVGKLVAVSAAAHLVPAKMELGGKGAAVVLEDVNVDEVAQELAKIITCNTGQMCCTASRWLVHEKIYKEFSERVLGYLKKTAIGYGLDEKAYMGPVVSDKQRKRILALLERGEKGGARALMKLKGMGVPGYEGGYYVSPGLLEGTMDNVCAKEEIFGPVAFLIPFKSDKEAIEIVHTTPYGLGNSVWSQDVERAERIAESLVAGINWINTHNAIPLGVPYAGYNLSGMGGGVNSIHTVLDYLRLMSVVRPQASVSQGV